MANSVSMIYYSDKLQNAEARCLDLLFKITAAKTVTDLQGAPVLSAFDAIASQAIIDAHLGTTNEFLVAAFDATSMGIGAFGGIVNMGGQAKEVVSIKVQSYDTGVQLVVSNAKYASTALTSSSLQAIQVACGASGNIAFKCTQTGIDAVTDGLIHVQIYWKAK